MNLKRVSTFLVIPSTANQTTHTLFMYARTMPIFSLHISKII